MNAPLVSIILPVHNAEPYLVDALASMVEQDFADWEMICVDDGSSDASGRILAEFSRLDARIAVVQQSPQGIVEALSRGCHLARAPLLCRMDADDIAMPGRLRLQTDYLRKHPQCVAVGGAILEIDGDSDPLCVSRLPADHAQIVHNLLHRKTGMFHPTTMLRTAAFEAVGGYRSKYQWIEDHDLWLRLSLVGELANLQQPVLCYRQHAQSVCWQRATQQRDLMNELMREAHRVRNLPLPAAAVLNSAGSSRTAAGPGKWARAAARGGFLRTTLKHLGRLHAGPAKTSYKWRMTLESVARLAYSLPTRTLVSPVRCRIPAFPLWRTRWAEACEREPSGHLPGAEAEFANQQIRTAA